MYSQAYIPINNDFRYDVNMQSQYQKQFILYILKIKDLAIGIKYQIKFRFSEIKKLHDILGKKYKTVKQILPELPKTNSIGLWNRTNKDYKKIQERRRELQYYFKKILNNSFLRGLIQIKTLFINSSKVTNRTQSNLKITIRQNIRGKAKSLPKDIEKNQY